MRKFKLCLIVLVCLFLSACTQEEKSAGFSSLSGEEAIEKISKGNDAFVLMITYGSSEDDCYACVSFEDEAIKTLEKNEIIIYRVDFESIEDDDDILGQLNTYLSHRSYSSFPTLFYIDHGSVSDIYEYSLKPGEWKVWLTKYYQIQTN